MGDCSLPLQFSELQNDLLTDNYRPHRISKGLLQE